jgi:type I restriction enzyme S subunit
MAGDSWRYRPVDEIKASTNGAIAIGPFGSRMKSDLYVANGVPVIRGNNISDTRALVGNFVYVTSKTADELRSSNVFPGDLFFPHRGAIGEVGIVPEHGLERYVLSSSLMKLTCNQDLVDPLFLFYFFRSAAGRHELLKNSSTVGTPGIGQPLSSLRSILVPVPTMQEQRVIAHILGTLDDKIELNRRMNETLEAMTRALFQSWFVDFDPVRAKAAGRDPGLPKYLAAQFPHHFQDSELGQIPEGWRVYRWGN